MENQDINQDQRVPSESTESSKTTDPNKKKSTFNVELAYDQADPQAQVKILKEKLMLTLSDNKEKDSTIQVLNDELSSQNKIIHAQKDQINGLELLLEETRSEITNLKTESLQYKSNYTSLENTLKERDLTIELNQKALEDGEIQKQSFLEQIARLQEVIQETEKEIEEIETNHIEIQNQLRLEIKRTEERVGQISADASRDTEGTLARNRHIRVVLEESEIGRIVLYIVDYFADSKKKVLALGTMCSELGITPIIARRSLRYLYELGVCDFNEVSREIKLRKVSS